MKWKGLIFDRDGTLFDSLPMILRSFNHAIEPFTERRPTDLEWIQTFGPAEPECIAAFIPRDKVDEATSRFYTYYREHIGDSQLFPGVREVLTRAKGNDARLGLFTGGGRSSTVLCLEKQGVLSMFDVLVTGDSVEHPKPHPEGVLRALEVMGVPAEKTLVVGDAGADVEAGKRAGACGVLVRWSSYPFPYLSEMQPDLTFDRVSDFERFLFEVKS